MPAISKIRLTNVVYEQGQKRYHDELFLFDGFNGAIVLENGGGKSVFIQTVLQAIIPHTDVGERKVKDTLILDEGAAHIAIEWLLNERPRRYAVTAVTLYKKLNGIESLRYVYEYGENDPHSIEHIPFVQGVGKERRPSSRGDMTDYYAYMTTQYSKNAKTFSQTIKSYREYIEKEFHIIASEWESIARINGAEGDIEAFFENCKRTSELIDRLLIPTVEKGMAGFKKDVFVDMFENRRDQLKKYKGLKEKIAQNKALSEELHAYVDRFRKVDEKEDVYVKSRRNAKGYQTYLRQEQEKIVAKLEQLANDFDQWHEQKQTLAMKRDSLTIQKKKQRFKELEAKEKTIQQTLSRLEGDFRERNHEYYSLQFAGAREEIRKEQGNINQYEQELKNLDRNVEVEELIVELEHVNGQIHYVFLEMKENIEKQIREAQLEKNQLEDQKDVLEGENRTLQQELNQWQERFTQAKTRVEEKTKQMKSLKSQLVSHEDESVEQLLEHWTEKSQRLDEEMVTTDQKRKKLEPQIEEQKVKSAGLFQQLLEKESSLAEQQEKKKQFDTQQDKLLQLLAETMPQWSYIDSVYSRHSSIENQIEERLSKLQRDKEKVLEEERQAKRFVDDYIKQEQFFADSYVEKQIQQWNQFDYLITGIQYIQSIGDEASTVQSDYPFWALTLITTDKEKQDVNEKIQSIQHHLTYPIFVISSNEARQLVTGEKTYKDVVEPAIWQMNQDRQRFAEWQGQIADDAERKTLERKETENSIQTWEKVKGHFQQFMKEYPHEQYVDITSEIQAHTHDILNLKEEQKKTAETIVELEKEVKQQQEVLRAMEREMQYLQNRLLPKAIEYMNVYKEFVQLEKQIAQYKQQVEKVEGERQRSLDNLKAIREDVLHKRDEIRDLEIALKYQVDQHELFQVVKGYRIVQTTSQMDALKIKRHRLNDEINQIQTTRSEWESRIENSKQRMKDLEILQRRWKNEYDQLDEEYPFPVNGEGKMAQLASLLKALTNEKEEVSARHRQAETDRKVQESRMNEKVQQYYEHYPKKELIQFVDEPTIIEEQLGEEERALQKRLDYLTHQRALQEKEQSSCLEAKQQFERYELVHQLEDQNLEGAILTEEEQQEFPYKRKEIVQQLIQELDVKQRAVSAEIEVLEQAKAYFKKFCNQLSDPKMRKNAIEGVETKKTYEEIVTYQQQLEERIARTNQIAEVTIQDYDKEQQQFITYIHTHLRKVREDLLDIQKKTRVKVADDWKTIYQIQVPDWDEDEAKEKIRGHIDWVLTQIEKDHYQDDHGQEDAAKVRQFIEKTLQTVPLLREVIGNQTIKVKCRKVESDRHISSNYYTWGQSNQWSGGEKWSKNMALFLGLLNFIAEKSQHIQSNVKRHRTVILDNPFGKASNEHVLSPVFFIADQLGFQIIALTAHAEGKFLSDYFPVVYSCKLRQLEGGTKQVLTKEKQIQTAYFQDHAPESLERLGERQQMVLFD